MLLKLGTRLLRQQSILKFQRTKMLNVVSTGTVTSKKSNNRQNCDDNFCNFHTLTARTGLYNRCCGYNTNQNRKITTRTVPISDETAQVAGTAWEFNTIKQFGRFVVNSNVIDKLIVSSINPQVNPCQDKTVIQLSAAAGLACIYDDENNIILSDDPVDGTRKNKNVKCVAVIPVSYSVDIHVSNDCDVLVEDFENDSVNVKLEKGNCTLKGIKSLTLNVSTEGGNVFSDTSLHANTNITTEEDGSVTCAKILGNELSIQTDHGNIEVDDIYADQSRFVTNSGDVLLGNCHRDTNVRIKKQGNLAIDSLDGHLDADIIEGDVDVYLLQHENVNIHTRIGDVLLKVHDTVDSEMYVMGSDVTVDDLLLDYTKLTIHEDGTNTTVVGDIDLRTDADELPISSDRILKAQSDYGWVTLEVQDWLKSLNLLSAIQ